jgi:hypothetical protein
MDKKISSDHKDCCSPKKFKHLRCHHHGNPDAIYGLGVIGALFYFLQGAQGFSEIITGIGKSVFWPAVLMFELLTYLQL